jgi:predicted permease
MIVENLLLIPLAMALAEATSGRGGRWHAVLRQSLASLARNPMVAGLVLGFVVSLLEWKPPLALERAIGMFAQTSAALSLFVIGGMLVGQQVRGMAKPMAQITAGKLLLHPLVMFVVVLGFEAVGVPPLEPYMRTGAVITAAVPMMGIYPILAQRHGRESLAAAAMLAATTASFVTVSLLLWMLRQMPGWV